MIIDDLIVLGKGAPDRISDGRVTICTGGYSPTHGFIRIYPTKRDSPLKRWNIVEVPVERNYRDKRQESWKIQGSKREWSKLSDKIKLVGDHKRDDRLNLIGNLVDDCVECIRDEGRSLGIIKPSIEKCYFVERDDFEPEVQTTLLNAYGVRVKDNYPYQPRICYSCTDCKTKSGKHDQQIVEWGIYEWMRKNPDKIEQVWENLRINSPTHDTYFFVGNISYHPNRYLVISSLPLPKGDITRPLVPFKKI